MMQNKDRFSLPNYEKWDELAKQRNKEDAGQIYNYADIAIVCPWVKVFRAGMVVVHKSAELCEILMIHERAAVIQDQATKKIKHIPMRRGFPKGQRQKEDVTALDTALRELREETGIHVANKGDILPAVFLIPRFSCSEALIYFVYVTRTKPAVSICTRELAGYEWINVRTGLKNVEATTIPTARLLIELENVNFDKL
jgi:8-oxo-dGTP pyrophosphatase MutT (NUDIX family)